jgi:hypothetical protein
MAALPHTTVFSLRGNGSEVKEYGKISKNMA